MRLGPACNGVVEIRLFPPLLMTHPGRQAPRSAENRIVSPCPPSGAVSRARRHLKKFTDAWQRSSDGHSLSHAAERAREEPDNAASMVNSIKISAIVTDDIDCTVPE
ncbi:hypothetical protein BaRGS_00012734 [Batillaria attramentaria]|uniref:Uncharacterized protein n=1 Tax=Batillaria attramentaria TaxID=370345 RepID=A0ABD0L9Z7_9CAEN